MQRYLIPGSIVVAGLCIAAATYFSGGSQEQAIVVGADGTESYLATGAIQDALTIHPYEAGVERDHLLGSPQAPIIFIEYSDLECPACKAMHPIMSRLLAEYGESGKVAWVYRHFWPRQNQYHPLAGTAAEASECVAELAGNNSFWNYAAKIFEGQPASLEKGSLARLAQQEGVEPQVFEECLSSGKYTQKVDDQFKEGLALGAEGTPYILVSVNGNLATPITGAVDYSSLKNFIDTTLSAL